MADVDLDALTGASTLDGTERVPGYQTATPNPVKILTSDIAKLPGDYPVNAQTGSTYAFADGDRDKLVSFTRSSAVAASIAQANDDGNFLTNWRCQAANYGVGDVTITPASSTINGASTLVLHTGDSAWIYSVGGNYIAVITSASSGGGLPTVGLTKPAAADFATWINQNGAAISDGTTGVVFKQVNAATNTTDLSAKVKTSGFSTSADWSWECRLNYTFLLANYNSIGIVMAESATGKSICFGYQFNNSINVNVAALAAAKFGSGGGSAAGIGSQLIHHFHFPWFRIRRTGATLYFEISSSGETDDWITMSSYAVSSAFTVGPDQCGLGCWANSSPVSLVATSARAY